MSQHQLDTPYTEDVTYGFSIVCDDKAHCRVKETKLLSDACVTDRKQRAGAVDVWEVEGGPSRSPDLTVKSLGRSIALVQFDEPENTWGTAKISLVVTYEEDKPEGPFHSTKKVIKLSGKKSGMELISKELRSSDFILLQNPVNCTVALSQPDDKY